MLQKGKNVLFNVYMYYGKIANPALEYGKEVVADEVIDGKKVSMAHVNREYVVDVLVPEEDYKLLKKKYKGVKSISGVREFDAKEFEQTFKVAPPYEAETYYVIKFNKKAYYSKDNNKAPGITVKRAPNAVTKKAGNVPSHITVDENLEFGNGTMGHVQWRERPWEYKGSKGLSLDLFAIGIVDLVEYIREDGTDFDTIEDDDGTDFNMDDMETDEAPFDTEEGSSEESNAGDDDW